MIRACVLALLAAATGSGALPAPGADDGLLAGGKVLYAPRGAADPARPFVRLAVNRFSLPNRNAPMITRTIAAFAEAFGPGNFEARVLSDVDSIGEKPDLVLGSAGTSLRYRQDGARNLATLMSRDYPDPNHGEGSLFVSLKTSGIRNFEDMEGRRAVFLGPNAFTGQATALGEIARRGKNPDRFFGEMLYAGASMPRELAMLRAGDADVAIVRTCFLEELRAAGSDVSDLQPVARRGDVEGSCAASTDLYPNWTLFATPKATPEVAREAAAVLLALAPDADGRRWGIASDFSSVDRLYRTLRRGPYEHLRTWSWVRFWEEYRQWIFLALAAVLMLVAHSLRSSHLVRVRTAQLEGAMRSLTESEARAKDAVRRIETMQKIGVVGQMSSVIAHELRQPLSAINGYAHGLLRLLERDAPLDREFLARNIEQIRVLAGKVDAIVKRVRSYAKRPAAQRRSLDLRESVREAAATVCAARRYPVTLEERLPGSPCPVVADPLEMELIFVNLIKNAMEAQALDAEPVPHFVRTEILDRGDLWAAVVTDNGPALSDEALRRLAEPLASAKAEGLGLGVSIVKMIAESYGGSLAFRRNGQRGLCATVEIPKEKHRA